MQVKYFIEYEVDDFTMVVGASTDMSKAIGKASSLRSSFRHPQARVNVYTRDGDTKKYIVRFSKEGSE